MSLEQVEQSKQVADDDAVVSVEEVDLALLLPVEQFQVTDEASANWVVRKIIEAREYGKRVKEWAARELHRAEQEEAKLLYLFGGQLEVWAQVEIGKLKGKRKSIALPAGKVGYRHEGVKLVVFDEEAVVAWAKAHCPSAVQVIEKLSKSVLNDHFEGTGEVPDAGVQVVPERDRFYIQ